MMEMELTLPSLADNFISLNIEEGLGLSGGMGVVRCPRLNPFQEGRLGEEAKVTGTTGGSPI